MKAVCLTISKVRVHHFYVDNFTSQFYQFIPLIFSLLQNWLFPVDKNKNSTQQNSIFS